MARLYVSLRLKNGELIRCYGDSKYKSVKLVYDRLLEQLEVFKISPIIYHKISDFNGAILKLCVRKNKKIRLSKIISIKGD